MQLSAKQMECIDFCLDKSKRIVAVTGEAGTGKTTIIRELARRLDENNEFYRVASPTGKAAKRIKEATGVDAITIHKLLEYGRPGERDEKTGKPLDTTTPKRDRSNPLDQSIIIVDEYSMVNHELNRNLIDALPRGGRLIVFGDMHQLPPIESYGIRNADGSPFWEHLNRPNAAFTLTEVYRQDEGSDVLNAAHSIRKGAMPARADNFVIRMTDDPVSTLRQFVIEAKKQGIDFGSIHNQILTTMKVRWIGTHALNGMLKSILNPDAQNSQQLERYKWDEKNPVAVSVGDKVVCTENTYDMRDFEHRFEEWDEQGQPVPHTFIPPAENQMMLNGETGIVTVIHPDGALEIDFGDRTVEVPLMYSEYWAKKDTIIDVYPSRAIDLAYALTTHKAQGSEYEHVAYIINKSAFFMLSRENMYTAVTRAKQGVTLITDQNALVKSVRTKQADLDKRRFQQASKKRSIVK